MNIFSSISFGCVKDNLYLCPVICHQLPESEKQKRNIKNNMIMMKQLLLNQWKQSGRGGSLRTVLLMAAMMLSLTVSGETYTKTYDFRTVQYTDYDATNGVGGVILSDGVVWQIQDCAPEVLLQGLMFHDVKSGVRLQMYDDSDRITHVSIVAGSASSSSANQDEALTYVSIGGSGYNMRKTPRIEYNDMPGNLDIGEYSFDVNILDGYLRLTFGCDQGPADFLLQKITVTYEVAEPEVKTYDFTSCQYVYDERINRNFIKIPGESRVWQMRPKCEAIGDNGLLIQGVTNSTVYLDAQEKYKKVTNITIKAAAAPNASASSNDVSAYIYNSGSSSSEDMKLTPKSVYQDKTANLAVYEYSYDCSKTAHNPTIGFRAGSEPVDFLIKEISITYQGVVNEHDISIDGVWLNEQNMGDVKGDGTVSFDGNRRLTFKNAKIQSLFYGIPELEIVLIGANTLESEYTAFSPNSIDPSDVVSRRLNLVTLMTDGTHSGSLTLTRRNKTSVPTKFEDFFIKDVILNLRDNLVGTFVNDGTAPYALISLPLHPILTEKGEREMDYGKNPGDVGTKVLTNVVIDDVLYTLYDTQKADAEDDGFDQTRGMVVLNSKVSEADMKKAQQLVPGTEDYAELFKGLTFMVPAGYGEIAVTSVTNGNHALHVKVGNQAPYVIRTGGELREDVIPYSCSTATYVYIYHAADGHTGSPDHRIGPKPAVTTGVTGLKVKAQQVDAPPASDKAYLSLKKGDIQWPAGGKGHVVVADSKITDLDSDAFDVLTASAPHRAASDYDITYIDLRGTSITGKEFSRESGVFKNLPVNTFVYLPAGNSVLGKNMVVGSVCDELDVTSSDKSFEAAAQFIATKASVRHDYAQGVKTPLCLPFGLSQPDEYGTFYAFEGTQDGKLQLKSTDRVTANTGYCFEAKASLSSIDASNVLVGGSLPSASGEQLIGTYEKLTGARNGAYYYDSASQTFKPFDASTVVLPFEAYLLTTSSASSLPVEWGTGTGILSTAGERQLPTDSYWYTLDGRRLSAQPSAKGLYIHQGKKILIAE